MEKEIKKQITENDYNTLETLNYEKLDIEEKYLNLLDFMRGE